MMLFLMPSLHYEMTHENVIVLTVKSGLKNCCYSLYYDMTHEMVIVLSGKQIS